MTKQKAEEKFPFRVALPAPCHEKKRSEWRKEKDSLETD